MPLFLIGFLIVLFGGSAMTLHKYAYEPIWWEIGCWVITISLFLIFEWSLHIKG